MCVCWGERGEEKGGRVCMCVLGRKGRRGGEGREGGGQSVRRELGNREMCGVCFDCGGVWGSVESILSRHHLFSGSLPHTALTISPSSVNHYYFSRPAWQEVDITHKTKHSLTAFCITFTTHANTAMNTLNTHHLVPRDNSPSFPADTDACGAGPPQPAPKQVPAHQIPFVSSTRHTSAGSHPHTQDAS